MSEREKFWQDLLDFAKTEVRLSPGVDAHENAQLKSWWTAFCLRYDLAPDTNEYDRLLRELWETAKDSHIWPTFYMFDLYMCEWLV